MKRTILLVMVAVALAVLMGCGGGGGGGSSTSFMCDVWDNGVGFYSSGPVNLVILGFSGGDPTYGTYQLETIHAISSSEIKSDLHARFSMSLGKPSYLNSIGVGVFEVRVTQGTLGHWSLSDVYDRWSSGGTNYALGYGPDGSAHPGWSVWAIGSTTYIGRLSDVGIDTDTWFISRGRSNSAKSAEKNALDLKQALANIAAKIR